MDKKKILIETLCALIMIMAVGYALLSQQLSTNYTATTGSPSYKSIKIFNRVDRFTNTKCILCIFYVLRDE